VNVPVWLWFATIAGILVLLAADLFIVDHNPHAIRVGEAAKWVAFYVTCAVLFGLAILVFSGGQYAGEFFAGYITEYSLSVDNLFVFVIIMTTFGVPAIYQHKVLLFGILAALVLRGLFIAAGAAVIEQFEWVFYLFGAFLLYTGWRLAFRRQGDEEEEFQENAALRVIRRFLPVTDDYHGASVFTRINGKRYVTPMLVVMLAIGTTDILFALDSIPAIFGLTKEPFLVFTSNAFALMGLRQLYFLLGGLLNRLVYLDIGLAVILAFIGVKLILEALHGEGFSWAPEIGIVTSLAVIVLVLGVTTALSLLKVRRDPSAVRQFPGSHPTPPPAAPIRASQPSTPAPGAGDQAVRSDRSAPAAGATRADSPTPGTRDGSAGSGARDAGGLGGPSARSGVSSARPGEQDGRSGVSSARPGEEAARSGASTAGPREEAVEPGEPGEPADRPAKPGERSGEPAGRPTGPARPGAGDHAPARRDGPVEPPPPRRSSGGGPARSFERGRPAPVTRSDLPAEGH
jgi:tellurite resistance protein TerC